MNNNKLIKLILILIMINMIELKTINFFKFFYKNNYLVDLENKNNNIYLSIQKKAIKYKKI